MGEVMATMKHRARHGAGRRSGLLCTQLFWSLRTSAWGRREAAGAAVAATRATRGSGGARAVSVFYSLRTVSLATRGV
eukprot:SAG31_NODE_1352_length_8668_cov_38.573229_2_plen_78_part_00